MTNQIEKPGGVDAIGRLLLIGSIVASAAGIAAFCWLFIPRFNIFWLILSPVILVCYQFPAVILFGAYKRRKKKNADGEDRKESPCT